MKKLISGGQTGVDRATLDVGLELGIPIGGWCPKGRRAEDGRIPDKYPLKETAEEDYRVRTGLNICDSDATMIIIANESEMAGGTLLTETLCKKYKKPYCIVDLSKYEDLVRNYNFRINVLNVAGPRESKSPGIYEAAKKFLLEVLR